MLDAMSFVPELPDADVYHALSSGMAGFTASLAKIAHNRPFVLTEQGLYLVERRDELSRMDLAEFAKHQILRFSETLVTTAYRYADCIVPPCVNHVRIEKDLGADVSKIKVINNGIEVNKFTPGPTREGGRLVVGSSARVVPIKGIHNLIQTAKLVREEYDADFVVFGNFQDKEYTQRCFKMVEDMGLKEHFLFTGHVTKPLEWYHKIDILTLASLSEGVPYALIEAMCCKLPCVCTAVGGVPEILPDESYGFIVPPNAPEKMAEKLLILLKDKELRQSMGEKAYARAHEKYDIKEMAAEFRHLYEGLLNGSNRN
jgi:glycosyltransferase involved in cell wall biosynthesis